MQLDREIGDGKAQGNLEEQQQRQVGHDGPGAEAAEERGPASRDESRAEAREDAGEGQIGRGRGNGVCHIEKCAEGRGQGSADDERHACGQGHKALGGDDAKKGRKNKGCHGKEVREIVRVLAMPQHIPQGTASVK